MPRSFVEQALTRCSVDGSKLWFNCNPGSPQHWFYTEWVQKREQRNALYLHFTMEDNPGLSEKIKQDYKLRFSGVFYQRYVLGQWTLAEGLIYPNYDNTVETRTGAMDDEDLINFVNRMKQLHAVALDRGMSAEAHTISIPVDANKMLLDYLKDDMYENFMLMNPSKALSGNMTATAIRLSYQQQDDKCGDFEYCIRDFLDKLFDLIGIEDEPSFSWNRIANQQDETNMVMTAANYLDDETLLNHLPWLTPEEVQMVLERRGELDMERFMNEAEPPEQSYGE